MGRQILILAALGTLVLAAGQKRKAEEPYALVSGTVFRESGLALPGAEVTLSAAGDSSARKFKKIKAIVDSRGEFAIRLPAPAAPLDLLVTARAKGFEPQEKPITVAGEDTLTVFFRLESASK